MCIEAVSGENQIETIEALAEEIWNEHFTPIIGKAQVDYMLGQFQSKLAIREQINNGFLYFLIKSNDNYIGYFGMQLNKDHLLLSKLYIRAAGRGTGFGRKAITFIEKLAIEQGASKISLTVNKYNAGTIAAYKKLGFQITGSMVQDIGDGFVMDDYRMEKSV